MRENDSLMEELQPEEILPVEETAEEQPQEADAEIVPEAEALQPDEPQEAPPESEEQPTEPADDAAAEEVADQEAPAEAAVPEESPAEAEAPVAGESKELPYHERFYLKYREGKRSTPLDLGGTKAFLQELGFDGGELRQAREGKNCAEGYRNADKNKKRKTTWISKSSSLTSPSDTASRISRRRTTPPRSRSTE